MIKTKNNISESERIIETKNNIRERDRRNNQRIT